MASSRRIKFWSAAPPRTLNPEEPSPAFVTPGNKVIALITSDSPRTTGICLIVDEVNALTLICGLRILSFSTFFLMTTSSKLSIDSSRL